MALETEHLFYRSSAKGTSSRLHESQSVLRMGNDSMHPKYNLEPFYITIFLFRKDWICGPKAPMDVQGLVWFTDGSGTEQEPRLGSMSIK
jgi:hypothetical protein